VEGFQWTRKHSLEHGLSDLLDHLAGSYVDIRPQIGQNVIQEVLTSTMSAGAQHLWSNYANDDQVLEYMVVLTSLLAASLRRHLVD